MSGEVGAEKKLKGQLSKLGDQVSVRESLVLTFFNVSHLSNTHYLGLWNPQMILLKVEFWKGGGYPTFLERKAAPCKLRELMKHHHR